MTAVRIVPCLDVRGDDVVKGVKFQNLRVIGDPVELARRYAEEGADELVLLDVTATIEERAARTRLVRRIRDAIDIPLTVGGGLKSRADARAMLDAGADRVSVNTAAVRDPSLITELSQWFGSQAVVVAIDAWRDPTGEARLRLGGGRVPTALSASGWARMAKELGAGEILLTSWDADGTGGGYDLALIAEVRRAAGIPVIASGGARTIDDFADALAAGASALLAATVFHDGLLSIAEIKSGLATRGFETRREELYA